MKLLGHLVHDWGLWSPPHAEEAGTVLRQFRHCRICARTDFRTIGALTNGRFNADIADCNRTETLQDVTPSSTRLDRIEERVRAIEQHLVL